MSHKFNAPPPNAGWRIPSDEYRAKRIREMGGTQITDEKQLFKELTKKKTHKCFFCKKPVKPRMFNHRTNVVLMGCDTPDCVGNPDTKESSKMKQLKKMGARFVDRKLTMDFKDLLFGRDPARMWARKDRIW